LLSFSEDDSDFRKEKLMKTAAATKQYSGERLYLAFELGWNQWKLALTTELGQKPWVRSMPARDLGRLSAEIRRAKERFELSTRARVVSCYEAGRDGFWLHRYLEASGIENRVVDASSIEVKRRRRRVKTDRVDAGKLVTMLVRWETGERNVWSVVRAPSAKEEDRRHLHRELLTLKRERTRQVNRIKGLLAGQGIRLEVKGDFEQGLERIRLWDSSPLGEGLKFRLVGEFERWAQIQELEARRRRLLRESQEKSVEQVRDLARLKGIGDNSAWLYVMEFFGWREFRNGKQVGSLAGLTPTPHQVGIWYASRGSTRPATDGCGRWRSRSPGVGCDSSRRAR
jgi:transposase